MGDWDDWPDNDGDATDWENAWLSPDPLRRCSWGETNYVPNHDSTGKGSKIMDEEDK